MKTIRLFCIAALVAFSLPAQTSNYPGSLDTISTLFVAKDNVQTTLALPMASGDTTAFVVGSSGWTPGMIAYICEGAQTSGGVCGGLWEEMLVTAVPNSQSLTVIRGVGGTTGIAHAAGRFVTNAITASYPSAAASAILAIETALGASLSNIPLGPFAVASKYAFSPVISGSGVTVAGGNLVIGNNTLTFTTVPAGVNGTDTGHSLYVLGGTGTAEACLITGGSGTGGASNGQIIVQCANTHSGAWQIQTATGGVAEAFWAGSSVIYVQSAHPATFHAAMTIPIQSNVAFLGDTTNLNTPSVIRASDYTTGDLFYSPAANAGQRSNVAFRNFGFANGPSYTGTAIHLVWSIFDAVGLYCTDGTFLNLDSTTGIQLQHFAYFTSAGSPGPARAVLISGAAGSSAATDSRIAVGRIQGNWAGAGIEITGADSLDIDTVTVNGMQTLILIDPPTGGSYVTNLRIHGGEMDAGSASNRTTEGIKIVASPTVIIGSVSIEDVDFLGYSQAAEAFAIDFSTGVSGYIGDAKVVGCHIFSWNVGVGVGALGFGGGRSLIISDNSIVSNVTSAITLTSPVGATISHNNLIGNGAYGIAWTGVGTDLSITGNTLQSPTFPNVSGTISLGTVTATTQIKHNIGIDNVEGTAATGATVTLPINPFFTLTGNSGTITTFGGFGTPGYVWQMIVTGTGNTTSAGATVGNSCTLAQNKIYTLSSDGTKIWINGPGC